MTLFQRGVTEAQNGGVNFSTGAKKLSAVGVESCKLGGPCLIGNGVHPTLIYIM